MTDEHTSEEAESTGSVPTSPIENEDEESTGLPWPSTWRGAYFLVCGTFVLWIALLICLERYFG